MGALTIAIDDAAASDAVTVTTGDGALPLTQTTTDPPPAPLTAVKALDDRGRVGGYLVLWGDADHRDLQDEYFTPSTDLALDWYPRRPILYHHGLDEAVKAEMIGVIESMTPDDTGLWIEGQLDKRNRWTAAVLQLVRAGKLGWSSGSLVHLAKAEDDGRLTRWPIVEGSMTPTPAEPRQPGVVPVKHWSDVATISQAYKSAGLADPGLLAPHDATEGAADEEQADESDAQDATTESDVSSSAQETDPMGKEEIRAEVTSVFEELRAKQDAERKQAELEAKAARVDELEAQLAAKQESDEAPAKRLPGATKTDPAPGEDPAPRIEVTSKFDGLKAAEMAFGVTMMQQLSLIRNTPVKPSEEYARALVAKAMKEGIDLPAGMKSDELAYSTQASYGDEWVPDMWSNELWRKARVDNAILPLFRTVEMPSNPFELPTQGTDPIVYYVPETTDETQLTIAGSGAVMPDSKIGSGKVTLSAKKLAIRVGFSAELVEDSIIPILPMYTEQSLRAMADAIDSVLLNGDTETGATGNINSDDGAPGATAKYLVFNGLRKLPLVTTTANAVDAAGEPTLANMRAARFTMAPQYSLRPNQLAWIVDASTYAKLLSLDEVQTLDKFGLQATALTGNIMAVDGIPIIPCAEMGLTEADGKASATPANNTKGQAICVYRPGWVVGYRRRVNATTTFIPYYDAYQMVATVRLAFVNFDADVSAALYDITV